MRIPAFTVVSTRHLNVPDLDKKGASLLAVLTKTVVGSHYVAKIGIVFLPAPDKRMYEKFLALKAHSVGAFGVKLTYAMASTWFTVKKCEYDVNVQ